MTSSPGPEFVIIGDDLSGSAESAAVFGRYGYDVRIGLRSVPDTGAIRVVDADTRQLTPKQAKIRTAAVIDSAGAGRIVLKLDSLLRGQLVPHLTALDPERHPVVFTPALPVQDRIVAGGIAYDQGRVIGGRPLRELIAPLPAESIPAALDLADLTERLAAATGRGRIAVCDALDDADLDGLVAAASDLPGVRFAGAAGLIAALARRLPPGPGAVRLREPVGPVLCVLGTAAETARRQVDALIAADPRIRVWTRPNQGWGSDPAAAIRDHLIAGWSAVIRLSTPVPADPSFASDAPELVAELAELTTQVAADPSVPLVLSGGQTARAVLDRLGVIMLDVVAEIHHGAVALRADDGRTVVTRPGSFGADDSLVRILAHLTTPTPLPDQNAAPGAARTRTSSAPVPGRPVSPRS
jgi:4-hydroxythreonine-4-phosphate dehydrogenase